MSGTVPGNLLTNLIPIIMLEVGGISLPLQRDIQRHGKIKDLP